MKHVWGIKINYEGLSIVKRKINIWGAAIGFIVIIGLFGPWIIRGYNSYGVINPQTGLGELRYHSKIVISPLFGSIIRDGDVEKTVWFVSFGTSLANVMLVSAAVLCAFRFNRRWVNFLIFNISFLGFILFFGSLGRGISIGVKARVGWGFIITLVGIILMFVLSLVELMRDSRYRKKVF